MKTIRVTLSEKAEAYFNEVAYSLDFGDGKRLTNSQIINHCLEELADFEVTEGQPVTGYLEDTYKTYSKNSPI